MGMGYYSVGISLSSSSNNTLSGNNANDNIAGQIHMAQASAKRAKISNRDDICDSGHTARRANIDYLPLSIRKPVDNINKT